MNSLVRFCMYLVVLLTRNDNSGILLILRGLALLYLIYCDIDSLRSFVLVRDYPELLSRVRKVDNLAVSYVGSVKALNTTQATMLAEYEKRVRKYEEYVASSAVYHALTFSSYGFKRRGFGVAVRDGRSRVSRTWRDAVPRLWMMWRLESHWNSLLVSVTVCGNNGITLPGHPADARVSLSSATPPNATPAAMANSTPWTPAAASVISGSHLPA